MRKGKDGYGAPASLERKVKGQGVNVHTDVPDGKHHSLGVSGGAGGVHYGAGVIQSTGIVLDAFGGKSLGMSLCEKSLGIIIQVSEAVARSEQFTTLDVDGCKKGRHGIEVHLLENGFLGIEYL